MKQLFIDNNKEHRIKELFKTNDKVDNKNDDESHSRLNISACTEREKKMVKFALKLTRTPWEMTEEDVNILRSTEIPQNDDVYSNEKLGEECAQAVGLTDLEIHDLVNLVGYFNYANRIVAGLGVHVGGNEGAPGQ